jgi:hypothetical protein
MDMLELAPIAHVADKPEVISHQQLGVSQMEIGIISILIALSVTHAPLPQLRTKQLNKILTAEEHANHIT